MSTKTLGPFTLDVITCTGGSIPAKRNSVNNCSISTSNSSETKNRMEVLIQRSDSHFQVKPGYFEQLASASWPSQKNRSMRLQKATEPPSFGSSE